MTWDQYWHGDVWMVKEFREADKLRQQRMNEQAWLQGLYVYDAIGKLAPILHAFAKKGTKPEQYPTSPYDFWNQNQEKKEKDEEAEALFAQVYMDNLVRAGKNWGKQDENR